MLLMSVMYDVRYLMFDDQWLRIVAVSVCVPLVVFVPVASVRGLVVALTLGRLAQVARRELRSP